MSTRFNKAYLLVPVIYIGVIFGLLFLQFSGGERFTRTVGPLSLRATRNPTTEAGEATVRGLDVNFNGLSFSFDEAAGLTVETPDEILDVPVFGVQQRDDGFTVQLEGGFILDFWGTEEPVPEVRVTLTVPAGIVELGDLEFDSSRITQISVPFRFVGTAAPDSLEQASFVSVAVDTRRFFFTAPPDAMIDPGNEKIVFRPSASGRAVRYVEAAAGNPGAVLALFADGANEITDSDYQNRVTRFIDQAYSGWTSSRYNSSSLTWSFAGASTAFSEFTLTAYLAEAWRRDDYDRAYAEMRRATDLHAGDLGLLSSAFLGNIEEITNRRVRLDQARSDEIRTAIEENRSAIFRSPGLFLFAADRGSPGLYQDLIDFASSVDLRTVDVTTAVGMIGNHLLSPHPSAGSREASERFVDLVETLLLGSIVQVETGFFLQSAPGQIDVVLSAVAGKALEALGEREADSRLIAIGRNLVSSVLGLAAPDGHVPATLMLRGETAEASPGFVPPEEIYPIVADNPSYPRQVSLAEEAGAGAWAWTVVDITEVRISTTEWRLRLEYPRLRTHFVSISGVPEIERLELFGQTWRDAPDFEIYSKGRHYDPATDTLMIKYYDDSVSRDIIIYL